MPAAHVRRVQEHTVMNMKYLHTMVRVTEVEPSLHFWRDALGLEVVRQDDYPQGRFSLIYLAAPGDHAAQIELTHNWDRGAERRPQFRPCGL
jgi:catechol 2,3-dioxygenase-like lactoylglutathione lyase family enzyme